MKARGKAFCYGDNVNTDVIIPARYMNTPDASTLAAHCMEDIDPSFIIEAQKGDIIVAGANFGCGSSREHAPLAIKTCGVSCVIASSFARIFFRNAINIGLAIVECPEAVSDIQKGDIVFVDFEEGIIRNENSGHVFPVEPFPPFLQNIIDAGGLLRSVAEEAR